MQLAGAGQIARLLLRVELLRAALPRLEVAELVRGGRIAHPLDRLMVGDEVHIRILCHIVQESLQKTGQKRLLFGALFAAEAHPTILTRKASRYSCLRNHVE